MTLRPPPPSIPSPISMYNQRLWQLTVISPETNHVRSCECNPISNRHVKDFRASLLGDIRHTCNSKDGRAVSMAPANHVLIKFNNASHEQLPRANIK
jgi:hypothetical protein